MLTVGAYLKHLGALKGVKAWVILTAKINAMWFGWISCEASERKYLRSLGITLGRYDRSGGLYQDCLVPDEAKTMLEEAQQQALKAVGRPRFIHLLDSYEELEA